MNVVQRDSRMNLPCMNDGAEGCLSYEAQGAKEEGRLRAATAARRERGDGRGLVSTSVCRFSHVRLVPRIQARSWGMGGLREGEGGGERSLAAHWPGPAANFRYSIPTAIPISISMAR
ncbi:MAG: hypothetical protein RI897_2739 [Verrucomicrobiota bacterium]|jgi:hypothetical protein